MVKTITVLLAAYQGEKYLPELLASLAGQDDPAYRVLMQDDGSIDGTPAILADKAAADDRFSLAACQGTHLGAVGNFLSLMAQDDAPYSALCDQDDVWAKQRLSRCRAAMEAAEARWGCDVPLLVHSDCAVTDAEGSVLHHSFFAHQGWDPAATDLRRLLVQNNATGCTMLMNAALRNLVVRHARADEMFMHDWFIAMTASAFGHVAIVNEPLVRYRQHGKNVMGASKSGLLLRAVKALGEAEKSRERILRTYHYAQTFRSAYGDALPAAAAETVDTYLNTQYMGKLRRVWAVQKGGYRMQSTVTRIGQMLFG